MCARHGCRSFVSDFLFFIRIPRITSHLKMKMIAHECISCTRLSQRLAETISMWTSRQRNVPYRNLSNISEDHPWLAIGVPLNSFGRKINTIRFEAEKGRSTPRVSALVLPHTWKCSDIHTLTHLYVVGYTYIYKVHILIDFRCHRSITAEYYTWNLNFA